MVDVNMATLIPPTTKRFVVLDSSAKCGLNSDVASPVAFIALLRVTAVGAKENV